MEFWLYRILSSPQACVGGWRLVSTGFDQARMLAIAPTGLGDVTETNLVWEIDRNVPKTPSMIADEGLIYSVSDDGIALCVDAATGEIVYRERLGGGYSHRPYLLEGISILRASRGKPLW